MVSKFNVIITTAKKNCKFISRPMLEFIIREVPKHKT